MPPVPFLGRLYLHEYLALGASFLLVALEGFIRTITLLLPTPIIRFLYRASRQAFNSLSSPYSRRARNKKRAVSSPIAQAHDFTEICELYGYHAEEHIVQTKDGYLLGLHRLGWKKGEEDQRVNTGPGSLQKKVVYLHHGLMMNSEVWVCITEKERCLPFLLVEQGYDVWFGNNRGNKYSKKSMHHAPTDHAFWNFSMDQFAFHDIPDSINYILSTTGQPSLSYIGFSQGTAQAFATLSIHPMLNSKVDVFVALAPAMAPPGLASGIVSSLVKSNPEVLFLAFGRRAILGSATMWQAILYPGIFTWFIDKSLLFLFNWRCANITPHQKLAAYPHLYSFTSTKSVVHWFQIIRNGTFQMYDDEVSSPTSFSTGSQYYKVAKFPTRNIRTPIVLVYGGSDSLVDINLMLKELPKHTIAKEVPKYEHLDLLWASDVNKLVFPHVLEALETFAQPSDSKEGALGWRSRVPTSQTALFDGTSTTGSQPPNYSEDEHTRSSAQVDVIPQNTAFDFDRPSPAEEQMDESDDDYYDDDDDNHHNNPERFALTPSAFAHSSRMPLSDRDRAGVHASPALPREKKDNNNHSHHVRATSSSSHASTAHTLTSRSQPRVPRSPPVTPSPARRDSSGGGDGRRRRNEEPSESLLPSALPKTPSATLSPARTVTTDQTVVRSRPEGWWSSTNSTASLVDPSMGETGEL